MNTKIFMGSLLGFAGVLPFFFMPFLGFILGDPQYYEWQRFYAAVILSFMGGTHWGMAVVRYKSHSFGDPAAFIISVTPALIAWVSLLLPGFYTDLVLIGGFIFMRAADYSAELPSWYQRLRTILTVIVIACLIAALSLEFVL